jgi:L-ascorbate metabolism protein UlaG (beta-lactamase superfamily)
MATTRHLATKGTQFFVPLGVGAHLEAWGVPNAQINEMDWWESITVGAVTINSTPNRHYSGRGLTDYKATLWSSWSLIGPRHRVFYSGDTGYSKLFKEIGRRMGPFDLSIIKVGAYGPGASWVDIHMSPEDAVRVHLEIKGKQMLPVHWGTFNMGIHAWDEPIRRTVLAAKAQGVDLLTPRIGELVTVGEPIVSTRWWEAVEPTSD